MQEYKLIKNVLIYKQQNESIEIINDNLPIPISFFNNTSVTSGWENCGILRNPVLKESGSLLADLLIFNKSIDLKGLIPICEFHTSLPNSLICICLYNPSNTIKKIDSHNLRSIDSYEFELIH